MKKISSYWSVGAKELAKPKSLAVAAMLCALAIVTEQFNIKLAPSLEVSLSFIPIALCSALTGPVVAVFAGMITDIVGAVIGGYVPFFFGYTLTAVLTAEVYALFLYGSDMCFTRILFSKATVNVGVNVLLGSVWRVILYSASDFSVYGYYAVIAMIKNTVMFPIEVALICLTLHGLAKPLSKIGFSVGTKKLSKSQMTVIAALAAFALVLAVFLALYYTQLKEIIKSVM